MSRHRFFVHRSAIILALVLVVLALSFPTPTRAAGILYTVTSLDDVADFTDGECTLREAIVSSNGNVITNCGPGSSGEDEIEFALGGTMTLTGDLPAVNGILTINGGDLVTIDGVETYHMFTVNSGKILTLKNLDLYRSSSTTEGGAVRNMGTLYVTASKFISNYSGAGGGAIYSYGPTDISDTEFINNISPTGGAIMNPGILNLAQSKFSENYADSQSSGGAVWSSGPLTISGSEFRKNAAGSGGAIYARRAVNTTTLGIVNSLFEENETTGQYPDANGGALLVDDLAATVQSSLFINNVGQSGGAIYVMQPGDLTLTNSTIRGSHETTNGGALYNKGTSHVSQVTLSGNNADHGGAIDNLGLLFLSNVTISGNRASYGGGLKNEGGTARLSNVTLFNNSASNLQGGGIMNTNVNTTLNLTNVIVANSTNGGNCAFATAPSLVQFNLSSDSSCNFGLGRDNVNVQLGPLANNGGSTQTHLPQYGSPAIDKGTDDDAPSIDQRGVLRPQGTFYDVGSIEVLPCGKPAKPALKAPADNKILTATRPALKWNAATCAKNYTVIVKDAATGKKVDKHGGLTVLKFKTDPLPRGKQYKWFVKACNQPLGCTKSEARFFTVQ